MRSRRNPWVAQYKRRSREYQRIPYEGGTVSVGIREEMESDNGLIHDGSGRQLTSLIGGGGIRRSEHFEESWQV
ncbi:hypothetical protein Acr_13g0003190 [Actinidia rufa]|uniref:Uncharacterized protein n=1 Tax=Actinidia rufa TaxID=165716 RepID=A0A7J0FJP4_9ERIC|nr:hypothetical protein Acr_13g0003190 [Actinidia rufa]